MSSNHTWVYRLWKWVNKLPQGLEHLELGNSFNKTIDNLPCGLKTLSLGKTFNKPVDKLPSGLETLQLYSIHFNNSIKKLPNNLVNFIFYGQIKNLTDIPNSVSYLEIGNKQLTIKDIIPKNIKKIHYMSNIDNELINKYPDIQFVYCPTSFV